MKKALLLLFTFAFILLMSTNAVQAQKKKYEHDSTYYEMYPDKLTLRLYVGQKVTRFVIPSNGSAEDVEYRANHKVNTGFGVTWHNYSLSAFYGFSFLNKDTKVRGKTKGLDLQFHLYPHKWAIDLLVVMPKGMYMHPKGYAAANSASYYYRPDVKERLWGISAYKVPNKEKFSYRASIVQNEWQKKSAGSVLYGGEAYFGIIEGDSAFVPKAIQTGFPQAGITEMRYITIAPGIGYAYTLVLDKHFFVMGSLVGNLDLNLTTEEIGTTQNKKTSVSPSGVYKAAVGYNSSTWGFNFSITGRESLVKAASSTKDYFLPTGAYRIALSKKIQLKKHG
ncbi:MAG: DUF4421 family protein [Bacteroidota bacterium]|nr:DUF4421 family protein [Bacteroidota bacterium]